eukprot:1141678-Pelagomonas_calceolata.AAC.1
MHCYLPLGALRWPLSRGLPWTIPQLHQVIQSCTPSGHPPRAATSQLLNAVLSASKKEIVEHSASPPFCRGNVKPMAHLLEIRQATSLSTKEETVGPSFVPHLSIHHGQHDYLLALARCSIALLSSAITPFFPAPAASSIPLAPSAPGLRRRSLRWGGHW